MEPNGMFVVLSVVPGFGERPPDVDNASGGAVDLVHVDASVSLRIAGPFSDEGSARQFAEQAGGAEDGMHVGQLHDPATVSAAAFAIGLR